MQPVVTCPCCGAGFTLVDLVSSPDIRPIGMMLEDNNADWNYYYFNHVVAGCGSTFTTHVEMFAPLLAESVPPAIRTRSCDCEGRCTSLNDLATCKAECHWAPYRRFLSVLLSRKMPVSA